MKVSDLRPFIPANDFVLSEDFYARLGWKGKDIDDGMALVQLTDQHFYIQNYYLKEFAENCMLLVACDRRGRAGMLRKPFINIAKKKFPETRVQSPRQEPYGAIVTFVHDPTGVLLHLCTYAPTIRALSGAAL